MFWGQGIQFDQNKSYYKIRALQIQDVGQNGHQIAPNSYNSFNIYLRVLILVPTTPMSGNSSCHTKMKLPSNQKAENLTWCQTWPPQAFQYL